MIKFQNTYNSLPSIFYKEQTPQEFTKQSLIAFNYDLASKLLELEIPENIDDAELANIFSGQKKLDGAANIALAYAGHQFGHFVPQLGDGRALLLGEVLNSKHHRFDIQLKGSGPTYYSRRGDGNSSLGPVIREYILCEAMHALGVPTTRALAAVLTGEVVYREQVLPGGIFTRVASSHIRIGTFEYFAAQGDIDNLKKLADYSIKRHYPALQKTEKKYSQFILEVSKNQARLIAKWLSIGFIHGVMNTDNISISGETIDYGPCAFMDQFSFNKVFSSIDQKGRYSYQNQTPIAKWNLYRLASCLIPLIDKDEETAIKIIQTELAKLDEIFEYEYLKAMSDKFGITEPIQADLELISSFLNYLDKNNLDFTNSFRELTDNHISFLEKNKIKGFNDNWLSRVKSLELMKKTNPVIIPRNHQVEKAIQAALVGELDVFNKLNIAYQTPFTLNTQNEDLRSIPNDNEVVAATFCGT